MSFAPWAAQHWTSASSRSSWAVDGLRIARMTRSSRPGPRRAPRASRGGGRRARAGARRALGSATRTGIRARGRAPREGPSMCRRRRRGSKETRSFFSRSVVCNVQTIPGRAAPGLPRASSVHVAAAARTPHFSGRAVARFVRRTTHARHVVAFARAGARPLPSVRARGEARGTRRAAPDALTRDALVAADDGERG
jgi:hypothetical protein